MSKHKHLLDTKTKIVLGLILLLAAGFRFYNLNWDMGLYFHPDERNIAAAVSNIILPSQMDPKFYAYGGFLIYLYKLTADGLALLLHNSSLPHDWAWINLIGRSYSAFFSVMVILPLYLLAKKLFDQRTGFITCTIYALTVSSIQTAHFSTTENLLTLLIVLITLLAINLFEKPSYKKTIIIGLVVGIAIATKTTGISFFVAPLLALLILLYKKKIKFSQALLFGSSMGVMAFITFCIFSPFTFLNWNKFMESMHYENSVVLGTNRVVYTLQFSNTPRYLFQLINLVWQLGVFAVIAIIGVIVTTIQELRQRRSIFVIYYSFPLLYFLYVGSWYTKFNRYTVPLLPFFIIFGCHLLFIILKKYRVLGSILISGIIGVTLLYAVAFMSVYRNTPTRITASEWIYQHIPAGKFILSEHWDEGLPIPLVDKDPQQYQLLPLTIYEPDNTAKLDYYANYLSQGDYITINSRRLYGTLTHLPKKYPLTAKYYQLLFNGKLGYKKVGEFSSYPQILGLTINDDSSEETFQVYDHPKALVFQNTAHYSFNTLKKILAD